MAFAYATMATLAKIVNVEAMTGVKRIITNLLVAATIRRVLIAVEEEHANATLAVVSKEKIQKK